MDFLEKTLEGLNIRPDDGRLSSGFDFDDRNNKEEDCVLIIGLNPAGGENDARREKNGSKPYFYSFKENTKGISDYAFNQYFRPIYDFVNRITKNDAKWQWCSKEREVIVEQIKKNEVLTQNKEVILKQYDEDHGKSCVIYVGEMFYYHETSSKKLPYIYDPRGSGYHDYSEAMLKLHIHVLKEHKKNIRFIYVNNAQASGWLCPDKTHITIEGIDVFLGGMLSGQGRMDRFSKERLIKEVSEVLAAKERVLNESKQRE